MRQTLKHSAVIGHHLYKVVWTPIIEEVLQLEVEDSNQNDKYAGAVMKMIISLDTCLIVFPEFCLRHLFESRHLLLVI